MACRELYLELGTNSYANKTYGTAEPYQPLPELMV